MVYVMLVEMLIRKKLISPNFLRVSAPTGTAAFQIGGGEISFLFSLRGHRKQYLH